MFENLLEQWETALNEAIALEDEFENLQGEGLENWTDVWMRLDEQVWKLYQISKRVLHADDDGGITYSLTDAGREEIERVEGRAS